MVQRILFQKGAPGSPEQTKPNQRCCKLMVLHPNHLPCKSTEGAILDLLQKIKNENESILKLFEQGCHQNAVDV